MAKKPVKYDPKLHPKVCEWIARAGRTDVEMAKELGISKQTLYNWKKKYPEFAEAITVGKAEPDERVERSLLELALGYEHPAVKIFYDPKTGTPVYAPYTEQFRPSFRAIAMWLYNRRPDRWKRSPVDEGDDKKTLETLVAAIEKNVQPKAEKEGK